MSAYGPEFQDRRDAERQAEEKERKARERQNAAIRKQRLDTLAAERQAQQDRRAAAVEAELAPVKARAKRQWLFDHPDKTESDFDTQAWPLLKENILEDRKEAVFQNEIAHQRRRMGGMI